jgi:hypothetical protein
MEGNREKKRAGKWKGIGREKVYGKEYEGEKGRYMEGNREGKGKVYGRE